jgi:hypothetical protein
VVDRPGTVIIINDRVLADYLKKVKYSCLQNSSYIPVSESYQACLCLEMKHRQKYPGVCTLIYARHPVQISRLEPRQDWQEGQTLIFSKRPLSNETISVRLSLPAPFGRGFLIFETRTVVLGDSVAGVALGVDKADDDSEGLRSFVRGSSGVGVALGDDKREDTGLHLSIADSALSMAVAIADDSARARAVLTDGQQKKSSNK